MILYVFDIFIGVALSPFSKTCYKKSREKAAKVGLCRKQSVVNRDHVMI